MLRTLLGHWKDHRKKPSLLPEDTEVHFEDPTTVNPLFEDSDSSIISTTRPIDVNTDAQDVTVLKIENEQKDDDEFVDNQLVDLSPPRESFLHSAQISKFISLRKPKSAAGDEASKKVGKSAVQSTFDINESIQLESGPSSTEIGHIKNGRLFETPDTILDTKVENENKKTFVEHTDNDNVNLNQVESFTSDEKANISHKSEAQRTSLETDENMRLYQPPKSAILNDNKSSRNITESQKNQIPYPIHEKITKVETIEEKVKYVKNNVIKNNNSQTTSELARNKQNAHTSNDELEKPAQLRAKAIQELIKKFQTAPSENDNTITKTAQSEKMEDVSHSGKKEKNPSSVKDTNNDRNTEFNASSQPSTSSKSVIEKEALSNIFKFPPPPPIENLKSESSLHGRLLAKKSNPVGPNETTLNKIIDSKSTLKESEQGKTRSDSSLERTRTTSSVKLVEHSEKIEADPVKEVKEKIQQPALRESFLHSAKNSKVCPTKHTEIGVNGEESEKLDESSVHTAHVNKVNKTIPVKEVADSQPYSKDNNLSGQLPTAQNVKTELVELKTSNSQESSLIDVISNKNKALAFESKANTSFANETANQTSARVTSPKFKLKSSLSKASSKFISNKDIDILKSHSEDSGITRGDQISSDPTAENEPIDSLETNSVTNPIRNKREKKSKSINKSNCKKCKHTRKGSVSLKKNQIDDYYDILTGSQHGHSMKHSDSCTSDLSWNERELLRRLHESRRGTVRSKTPSTRSKHSRHTFVDDDNFRRLHALHRSSDESSFYQASVCSCDQCWSRCVKDYAYTRSSLRGMPPIYEICTCGSSSRRNFIGRRVKFHSDTIPEVPASAKSSRTTTPVPKNGSKHDDSETDDKSSDLSSRTKDDETVSQNPDGTKKKKITFSEKEYRIVTPWELEEWNHFKKKEEIKKRRKRARYMGLMALAMVVFVGFVVTILMVYLRRKVL